MPIMFFKRQAFVYYICHSIPATLDQKTQTTVFISQAEQKNQTQY
jgi:hypothetical protein